jgi:L-rhamnose-proton symport protein RhaT
MNPLVRGFLFIFVAAVAGGAFGLQYRVMRKYSVANASLLSMLFATVPIPLIACSVLLPGWTHALARAGLATNAIVFAFGFCWGLGAITYAYGFNILGMALAASLLKGITIAVGSGGPLIRHWDRIAAPARLITIAGLMVLMLGTALAGRAGIARERQTREAAAVVGGTVSSRLSSASGKLFWVGLGLCLFSGVVSSCANLGYDRADYIEKAMTNIAGENLTWKATLVRWMPMYWGGITALVVFMGGSMLSNGSWRNYYAPGTARDFAISSSMGFVHFLAQIPYGIGAYYLGRLGTSAGWGLNIGMALLVATALGFLTGEWRGVSRHAARALCEAVVVLTFAIGVLAYANSLS